MAFRMQTSVPEVMDISKEPESIFKLYGKDAKSLGPLLLIVYMQEG